MGDERVCIATNGKPQKTLNQVAEALGFLPTGELQHGYGSVGCGGIYLSDAAFLRVPSLDSAPNEILQAYVEGGARGVLGVYYIDVRGNSHRLGYDAEDPNWGEVRVPEEVAAIAMIMELLPEAPSLSEVVEAGSRKVIEAYHSFGQALRNLHDSGCGINREQRLKWLVKGAYHPIEGRERLFAIKPYISFGEWITEPQFDEISNLMKADAGRMVIDNEVLVSRIHGDAWRENVRVREDGEIVLFDNALKYGPLAYDVGFAIGDRVLAWLTMGNKSVRDSIDAFMSGYEDATVLKDVFVALGFKSVVGAAFDNYADDDREKIIKWAISLLTRKRDMPDLVFSLDLAMELWRSIE